MGITDAPKQVNLTDIYPEGTAFRIEKAWVEGVVKTQYGDRTMAKVLVTPLDGDGSAREFAVWGSLCEQVQQVEEGELPGNFKVTKDGQRWLFVAAEDAEPLGEEPAGEEAPTS